MTSPHVPTPDGVRTLTEAKALSAWANPFRARMIDTLQVDGPATASALASRTGQAVGSASYHLKVLADAGLTVEAPELAKDRRERWWRLADRATRWTRADFTDDPAAIEATHAAEALALQRQMTRAQAWLDQADGDPEWDDAAFVTQHWLHVSAAELRTVADELNAVLRRWSSRERPPDDDGAHQTVLVFARGFPAQP